MKRFKMDIMDLEESLKICNNFLTKAETVLGTLASDITSYLIEVGVLGLVGTAVVVLGTAGAGGAGEQ